MRDFREIFRNAVRFELIRFGFERFKTRQKALWDKDFKGTEMSQAAINSPELTTTVRSLENRLGSAHVSSNLTPSAIAPNFRGFSRQKQQIGEDK